MKEDEEVNYYGRPAIGEGRAERVCNSLLIRKCGVLAVFPVCGRSPRTRRGVLSLNLPWVIDAMWSSLSPGIHLMIRIGFGFGVACMRMRVLFVCDKI